MPRLWSETIEAHRREVRDAILETTVALAKEHGPLSLNMSQIAEQVGIGRATLYKYFPSVEEILHAWHHEKVTGHIDRLSELRDQEGHPFERLTAVLEAYALIQHELRLAHGTELEVFLHRSENVDQAKHHVHGLVRDLLMEAAGTGHVRDDVAPAELATFCLHSLSAATRLESKAAVRRLVEVTLDGLSAPR